MYSAPGAGQMPRGIGICWRACPPTKNVSVSAVASIDRRQVGPGVERDAVAADLDQLVRAALPVPVGETVAARRRAPGPGASSDSDQPPGGPTPHGISLLSTAATGGSMSLAATYSQADTV